MVVSFAEVRGQERAIGFLRKTIAYRIPQALLFSGPPGVGKTTAALAFAAALNCEDGGDDACGTCRSCRTAAAGRHPDIRLWERPEGKRGVGIDLVRALEASLALKPYGGGHKVAVLRDADTMGREAANAFLLTLEEPPVRTVIILTAANPEALPETVLSRCRRVFFQPLSEDLVAMMLAERSGVSEEEAREAALLGEGSLTAALAFLDEGTREAWRATLGLVGAVLESGSKCVVSPEATRFGARDEVGRVLEMVRTVVRLALRRRLGLTRDDSPGKEFGELARRMSERRLTAAGELVERSLGLLRGNVNPRLVLEGFLVEFGDLCAPGAGEKAV